MLTPDQKINMLRGLLVTGSPEQQAQARRTLNEMFFGGPGAPDLAVFSAGVKKRLEAAHRRSNWIRLVPLRARIREAVRFLLAPWSRQRDEEILENAELLRKTRADLVLVIAKLGSITSAVKVANGIILQLHERQLRDEEAITNMLLFVAQFYRQITGDDSAILALESPKPVEPNADVTSAVEELRRMFNLGEPPESKL